MDTLIHGLMNTYNYMGYPSRHTKSRILRVSHEYYHKYFIFICGYKRQIQWSFGNNNNSITDEIRF